jgi:4-carboxymuconolactone decarboxylase
VSERMPMIPDEAMSAAQRGAVAELIAGPRGGVRGPFVPLLRSPELLRRLQRVGEYLRYESALAPQVRELATLVVARYWTQQFEWTIHYPLAVQAGVSPAVVEAIGEGRRPAGMPADEAVAYDCCEEVFRVGGLSDALYARALAALGEAGLVDLLGLVGYFSTVSIVMNVAQTPPPDDPAVPRLATRPVGEAPVGASNGQR